MKSRLRRTAVRTLKRGAGVAGLGVAAAMTAKKFRRVSRKRKGTRRVRSGSSEQNNQWKKTRTTMGRRPSNQSVVNKLTMGNVSLLRYQFKGLSQFTGDQGYYALSNMTNTAATQQFLPVYMIDMTTVKNTFHTTPDNVVMWRLSYLPSGSFEWVAVNGLGTTGASTLEMQVITNPTSNTTTTGVVGQRGYLSWARTRLNLYGQTTRPTTITAQIIKPIESWIVPKVNSVMSNTGIEDVAAINYWTRYLKSKLVNPIASQYGIVSKEPYRVLASKKYVFEPKENTDIDPDPYCRTVDWFWRSNSIHRFNRPLITNVNTTWDDADKNQNGQQNDAGCSSSPWPVQDSRWMLITADVFTTVSTDVGWTAAVAPSFDLNLETCWKLMI